MDSVGFFVVPPGPDGHGDGVAFARVGVLVNGRPLQHLAGEVERPFAEAEQAPGIAGGYGGLPHELIQACPMHFLGDPVLSWFDDGDTVLLGCSGCGEWGCWPLTAQVDVSEEMIVWHGFRTGFREWDLNALGPFRFARARYEAALFGVL